MEEFESWQHATMPESISITKIVCMNVYMFLWDYVCMRVWDIVNAVKAPDR
jgi:hypothetical protein